MYKNNLDCLVKLQKRVIRQFLPGVHPLTPTEPISCRLKILRCVDLVDYIIGIFMCKVYHWDFPRVFENYYIKNSNIHDHVTRQTDYIHIVHADTNLRNMTMRFQGGNFATLLSEIKYHIMTEYTYSDVNKNHPCWTALHEELIIIQGRILLVMAPPVILICVLLVILMVAYVFRPQTAIDYTVDVYQ